MTSSARRVLFVLGTGSPGGVERHVASLARSLAPSRWKPSAVALFSDGPLLDELRLSGVEALSLAADRGRPPRGWSPMLAARLRGAIRRMRPDVVHSHEMHGALGLAMRSLPGLPWIHTEHCSFDRGPSPGRARLLWKAFGGRVDDLLAVSSDTADGLARGAGLDRRLVAVVPNAVALPPWPGIRDPAARAATRAELGFGADDELVGCVGRLVPQKGWDEFLDAAEALAAIRPAARFAVVGDGPERASIEARIAAGPLAGRARIAGAHPDGARAIAAFDLFLMTSRHEESPTTLLEAFAAGTPVVAFPCPGGMAEIAAAWAEFASADWAIETRDPVVAARVADGLLNDPARSEASAAIGRAFVERRHSMEAVARILAERYDRLA